MRLFQKLSQFFKRLSTAWRGVHMKEDVRLINMNEAVVYVETIEDLRLRWITRFAVISIFRKFSRGEMVNPEEYQARIPDCSFDALFYAKMVYFLLSDERIKRLMKGQKEDDSFLEELNWN